MIRPDLWVVAGPMGAGKTTFCIKFLVGLFPIINPDQYAEEIDRTQRYSPAVQAAAGRMALSARQGMLSARKSFAIETTLAGSITGSSEISAMDKAWRAGYRTNLVFIGLDDVALSEWRGAGRTRARGNTISIEAMHRRYAESLGHLAVALPLADRAWVFDNSSDQRILLWTKRLKRTRTWVEELPKWAGDAIPAKLREPATLI